MKKKKIYRNVSFSADTIKEAIRLFDNKIREDILDYARHISSIRHEKEKSDDDKIQSIESTMMSVQIGEEEWVYDSEDEFFSDYRKNPSNALYNKDVLGSSFKNSDLLQISWSRLRLKSYFINDFSRYSV